MRPDVESGTDSKRTDRLQRLEDELDTTLEALRTAPGFAKSRHQTELFRVAADLLDSDEGIRVLAARASRFDEAGVFHQGPWDEVEKLLPDLVGSGLRGDGVYPAVEALSELRILGIARGQVDHPKLDAEAARTFLRAICAKNLDLILRRETEETRARPKIFARAWRLFELIGESISLAGLRETVVAEIEGLCAQRPIQTAAARELIERASQLPSGEDEGAFELYRKAIDGPTEAIREAGDPASYRQWVVGQDTDTLLAEARACAATLDATGLGHWAHAVLLRRFARTSPEHIGDALGLDDAHARATERFVEDLKQFVGIGIFPHTADSILGLHGVLDRSLLARDEVSKGLRRIVELDIRPDVAGRLLERYPDAAGLSPNAVLLSGCLSVLGQPLGVGQGRNPTCQAARGISLWSLHAPGQLLGMIATAARDDFIASSFEGAELRSNELEDVHGITAESVDPDLDPVSRLLVPHLDRIYARMLALTALRGEDSHKWVNPAIYGRWVTKGFMSAIQIMTHRIDHHENFVRHFYASHHPHWNDEHELIYPNPVGIMVTDVHGRLLGPHAVSLQRVAEDPDGTMRCYFFNPNNEGRQDWGDGVRPSVAGSGERPGESSLPFEAFASRLYAFHFDPQELGETYAVPSDEVKRVSEMAAESWGRAYTWVG